MIEKKGRTALRGPDLKANSDNQSAPYDAIASKSQLIFLRRFGLTPTLAAVVAPLAFGEART